MNYHSCTARPAAFLARPAAFGARPAAQSARKAAFLARKAAFGARPAAPSARKAAFGARPAAQSARPNVLLVALLLLVLPVPRALVAAGGAERDGEIDAIRIVEPWARATIPSAANGAAYLEIHNDSGEDDTLLGGRSPIAGVVEVHDHQMEDNVMRMIYLEEGLPIAAGESVILEPQGYHLMIIGLSEALVEGETVPITLEFERAGEIEVDFEVRPLRERSGHGDSHDGSHDEGHGDSHHDGH